jgi:acetylornithine deacetylase
MDARESKLLQAVDGFADDMLDFTCRLVAVNSTLGHEAPAVELMHQQLQNLGLSPVRVPIDPQVLATHPGFAPVPWEYQGRTNVVAVRPADGDGGRSAVFNGHLDVVDAEPVTYWETDPYTPVAKDGRLYGRGAGDMKSGVAAMVYAVAAIDKAGFGLSAPVTLQGVIEEECCGNGALACLQAGYDGDAVLIPEPFGPTLLTSQLGVLWFKVTVAGKPVHVYEAPAGTNAIEKSFRLIDALRTLEQEMNAAERPSAYQSTHHPINLNTGIFEGGSWPSTVPARAEFHCRLSYFPGTEFATVRERILKTLKGAAADDPWLSVNPPQVEFYGFRSDGHTLSREHPVLKTLNDCHRSLTGADADTYIATATTDLRAFHFFSRGDGTCFGPKGGNYHGANEWVDIDSIRYTARAYALFLARWCRLRE